MSGGDGATEGDGLAALRALALEMPGAEEGVRFGHVVWRAAPGGTGFVWVRPFSKADVQRDGPAPEGTIVAFRVADDDTKRALLAGESALFTIQHFDGFPAVLGVLEALDAALLGELVIEAWLATAPATARRAWLDAHPELGGDIAHP
ncbi:MmcQ/YjbR family DNA-binding protein [Schumannella sp. 10F1B-5-1]|uniref:MmcQ/YjbR family DNA-binding protein n=1 Tax=Schumannella sp. 10F1B-5-1 TaxID=2590780 RepID=UPI0015E85F58|nr:MmcQ/YjbR family DNA-binding protein [Schumannella sp. 10F1B-5-1]